MLRSARNAEPLRPVGVQLRKVAPRCTRQAALACIACPTRMRSVRGFASRSARSASAAACGRRASTANPLPWPADITLGRQVFERVGRQREAQWRRDADAAGRNDEADELGEQRCGHRRGEWRTFSRAVGLTPAVRI